MFETAKSLSSSFTSLIMSSTAVFPRENQPSSPTTKEASQSCTAEKRKGTKSRGVRNGAPNYTDGNVAALLNIVEEIEPNEADE